MPNAGWPPKESNEKRRPEDLRSGQQTTACMRLAESEQRLSVPFAARYCRTPYPMLVLDLPEFRLVHTIILTGLIVWIVRLVVRRLPDVGSPIDDAIDVILWSSALATGLVLALGWLGHLTRTSITLSTLALAVVAHGSTHLLMKNWHPSAPVAHAPAGRSTAATAIALSAGGFVLGALYVARTTPILATDALIYHIALPACWIQDAQIAVKPLWFHNPANSYSPLLASCLYAWLMLPMGNDVLARFGQSPFLLLCGLCMYRLLRHSDVSPAIASAVAMACCISRPFLSETLQAKDDVILTAAFLATICGLIGNRVGSVRRYLRSGTALGLMLATKYTALLALPVIVLLILWDLCARRSKRGLAWGIAAVVLIAGPWYVRNTLIAGNPVFPVRIGLGSPAFLKGLFSTRVAPEDLSLGSLIDVVVRKGRFSMPWEVIGCLGIAWLAGYIVLRRRWREPLVLTELIGPVLLVLAFHFFSPFREVRFLLPAFALLYVATGETLGHLPGPRWVRAVAVGIIVAVSFFTCTHRVLLETTAIWAIIVPSAVLSAGYVWRRWIVRWNATRLAAVTAGAIAVFVAVYVYWGIYVDRCRIEYPPLLSKAYRASGLGPAWNWLDQNASPGDTIAYTGTPMTYPLMGFDWQRRAVYVPIEPNVDDLTQLPPIAEPLTGYEIVSRTAALYRERPNQDYWLDRMTRQSVRYLLTTPFGDERPIEERWADESDRFRLVYRSGRTNVYLVSPSGPVTRRASQPNVN